MAPTAPRTRLSTTTTSRRAVWPISAGSASTMPAGPWRCWSRLRTRGWRSRRSSPTRAIMAATDRSRGHRSMNSAAIFRSRSSSRVLT